MAGGRQKLSVLEALQTAYDLALPLEDWNLLGATFRLLSSHFVTLGNIQTGSEMVREMEPVATAEKTATSDLPIMNHLAAANYSFWRVQFDNAVAHVERLEQIYEPDRLVRITQLINHDPISHAQNFAGSLPEWIRGFPDRAMERVDKAVRRAREVRHPLDLMFNLTAGVNCLIFLDLTDRLPVRCDEAEQLAREEALGPFAELVWIGEYRGAALIGRGNSSRAMRS